jgi:hypothetical protein
VSGSGTLAILYFRPLPLGESAITLFNTDLFGQSGAIIPFTPGQITVVSAVLELGAFWPLAAGIPVCCVFFRRSRLTSLRCEVSSRLDRHVKRR